jgi:exosortase
VRALILGAIPVVVIFVALFWEFLSRQFRFGVLLTADWGHTLAIPLIAGYFVYLQRDKLRAATPFKTTWIGLVPVVAGVAWYMLCTTGPQVLNHHNYMGAGVALTLFGIALLFFGFRGMAWLWFPLLYLIIFGQTISPRLMEIVTFKLQDITAWGAHIVLTILGLDVERAGNTLNMFDEAGNKIPLNVAEACSGMRMLMAFLALGVAMAFLGLNRFWQQAIVVLMGIPVAVFVNVLRVVTLSLLAIKNADFAAGDFHTFIGLIWLVPAFLIFLGVIWIVRNMVVEPDAA